MLQQGLPALLDLVVRAGLIPDSLVLPRSVSAPADCAPAVQRAQASAADPRVVAQARMLVWRMGFRTGFVAGMADATVGSTSAIDPAPLLAEPRQIAELLGVDPPTLPVIQHAANALNEFQVFVAQGAACVAPQLAGKYTPREAALFKYGLIAGHAVFFRLKAPQLDPVFVPELRAYGAEAQLPPELSQPFVDSSLTSLPGNTLEEKAQSALGRIEEFLKANR